MTSLQQIFLIGNMFNRTILKSVGKVSMLTFLDLSNNHWEGVLIEAHFQNHTQLSHLYLFVDSATWSLLLDVKHDWVPPFNLPIAQFDNMTGSSHLPTGVLQQ